MKRAKVKKQFVYMQTQNAPIVRDTNNGIFRRLNLIPLKSEDEQVSSQCAEKQSEVVRCINCEHTIVGKDGVRWCRLSQGLDGNRKDMDFCSYGKPKEVRID